MNIRHYNVFFHLHTVSGIVISVLLYIIFFSGSFSFFRDEIVNWERNDSVITTDAITTNLDVALDSLKLRYNLKGRDITFSKYYEEQQLSVSLSASKDTLVPAEEGAGQFFYLDGKDFTSTTYQDSYTLGEFLYRLHFLDQVKYPYGRYLSGFVAFFFLFALITGLLIHWDKIVSNFYLFRPKAKLKTVWTDAHTALGTIGFPFQLVYAVTGAFFLLKILAVAPNLSVFYKGDQTQMYRDLEYNLPTYDYLYQPLQQEVTLTPYLREVTNRWEDFRITRVDVLNYGDANMHIYVEGHTDYSTRFNGAGKIAFCMDDNKVEIFKEPAANNYTDGVKNFMNRLHFGDYAGYPLRIVSFLMGIIGCLVIISGVMIWLTARNKKNLPDAKRKFYERVARIYLAICLSMYPVTALAFLMVKLKGSGGMSFLYTFYFITWLIVSVAFILKKDNRFTNSISLLSGSILGICIPVVNGLTTGNWFWVSYARQSYHVFFIDVFWLILGLVTLYGYFKINRRD